MFGGGQQQPGLPWERQRFRIPKPLPATGKRCKFGTPLWCLLDSLGCLQRWILSLGLCPNPPVLPSVCRFSGSRSQEQDAQESLHFPKALALRSCRSHQQASRAAQGRWDLQRPPHGGLGTAVALSGGGLGAGLGNHKLSCHTTKPVTTRCCSTPPDVKSLRFPSQERTLSISLNPECPSDLTSAGTKKFCFQGPAKNPFQNKKDRQLLTKGSAQSSFTRPLEGVEGSPLSQDLGDPNQHVQSEGRGPPPGRTSSPFQRALPAPQPTSGSPFSLPGIPRQLSFLLFLPAALTTSFLSMFGLE